MRDHLFRRTAYVALAAAVAAGAVAVAAGPAHAQPLTLWSVGQADWRGARCQLLSPVDAACGHDGAGVEVGWIFSAPPAEQALGAVPSACPRRGRE